jgi:hypothetical protein|tara:strand:- start:5360 stop:5935 length:576 start_codon:yes stop_codon:yes gene_type:complete
MQEQYSQEAIDAFVNKGNSIPGQSLTSNPDEPRPFEGAPEFVEFKEALDYTVEQLLEKDTYMSLMAAVSDGVPILDLVMQITYVGFRDGRWNPDLMMMLIEPLIYVMMALAEKADIEYRIDDEDDTDDGDSMLEEKARNIASVAKAKMGDTGVIPAGVVPEETVAQIEQAELPTSLLERTEEEPSLLSRGQ